MFVSLAAFSVRRRTSLSPGLASDDREQGPVRLLDRSIHRIRVFQATRRRVRPCCCWRTPPCCCWRCWSRTWPTGRCCRPRSSSWWPGFALGPGMLGVIDVTGDDELVGNLAELALFAVLFTDGMRVGFQDLRRGLAAARPRAAAGAAADAAGHRGARPLRRRPRLARVAPARGGAGARPTRCSRPRWSATTRCPAGCAICSTWSPASTTGWRCRSSWCCSRSPPARRTCTSASSPRSSLSVW